MFPAPLLLLFLLRAHPEFSPSCPPSVGFSSIALPRLSLFSIDGWRGLPQLVAVNLSLTAPEDNCAHKLQILTQQAQMLFGPDKVHLIANGTGAFYSGLLYSNVTLLQPSTNAYGETSLDTGGVLSGNPRAVCKTILYCIC